MSYKIESSDFFEKQFKKLLKKYLSLKSELRELQLALMENPAMGTPLRDNIYKIRLAIASKNKGKSGGARVITLVRVINETVYLLSIYNKGEKDTISESEIDALLEDYEDYSE